MRKVNELKAGSILSYVNLAIGCVIPLLYTPVMLDILGQDEYGLYSLANSVISYLSLLNFGMGAAVIRYITKFRALEQKEELQNTLGLFAIIYSVLALLVCVGGVVVIALSGSVFGQKLDTQELEKMRVLLLIMTVSTAVSFPLSVYSSAVIVFERYVFHKLIGIAQTILTPVVNLLILYAGCGSVGLAVVGIVFQIVSGVIFGVYCGKTLRIRPVFRNMPVGILKELVVFCGFVFLSSVVDILYWATDKVLIGAMVGTAAVAVYNVGGTFTSMLQNMAHAISNVFAPRVNMMVTKNASMEEISQLLIRVGRLQFLVVSLILSGYIVFGRAFVLLWVGTEYLDAYYVALLTMIPLTVPLIQNIAFTTIVAQNKHRFRSIVYAVIAVVNVVTTWLVLPYYGIIGAAVCTAAAFVLGQGLIMNFYYYKVIGLDIPGFWKQIGRMSIVPSLMIVAGCLLTRELLPMPSLWWLFLWAGIYTVIFAALSWVISMNPYEKNLFAGLVTKVFPRIS